MLFSLILLVVTVIPKFDTETRLSSSKTFGLKRQLQGDKKEGRNKMKRKKLIKVLAMSCLVLVLSTLYLIGPIETDASEKIRVIFGVTSSKSGMYPWQAAHGTIINQNVPDLMVTTVECPHAAAEVLEHIRKGEMHFGIGGTRMMYRAYHGIDDYQGRAIPHLRSIMTLAVIPFTIFVSQESGIQALTELEGKKFGTSFPASLTGKKIHKICDALGIRPNYFEATMGATIEAYKAGKIVGFIKPGAPDSAILTCAAVKPIRLLPITKAQFEICKSKYPGYFSKMSVIPAGTYPGQKTDISAVTFLPAWVGTSKLSQDIVYKMLKVWYENRKTLAALYAAANKEEGELGFPKLTIETASIPLHAGAYKFYRELGLSIPDRLIPPEVKK